MGEIRSFPTPTPAPTTRYTYAGVRTDTADPYDWFVLDRGEEVAKCTSEEHAALIAKSLQLAEPLWIGVDLGFNDSPSSQERWSDLYLCRPDHREFRPIVLGAEVCKASVYADTPGARRMIDLRAGASAERAAVRASIRAFRNGVQALMIRLGFTEAAEDAFLAWELMTIAEAFHRDTELGDDQRQETLQRAMRDLLYFDGYSFIAADDAAIGHLTTLIYSGVGFAG